MINCYNTYLESWHKIFPNYICCPKWSHLKAIVILLDICQNVYGMCSYSWNQWVQWLWRWIQWYQFHFTICETQSIGFVFVFQSLTIWENRVHRTNNKTVVVTVVNWHIVTVNSSIQTCAIISWMSRWLVDIRFLSRSFRSSLWLDR